MLFYLILFFFCLHISGILDSDTVEVMSKRRCGVPDEPKQFSVNSIKSKRHKRGFFWQIYHGKTREKIYYLKLSFSQYKQFSTLAEVSVYIGTHGMTIIFLGNRIGYSKFKSWIRLFVFHLSRNESISFSGYGKMVMLTGLSNLGNAASRSC